MFPLPTPSAPSQCSTGIFYCPLLSASDEIEPSFPLPSHIYRLASVQTVHDKDEEALEGGQEDERGLQGRANGSVVNARGSGKSKAPTKAKEERECYCTEKLLSEVAPHFHVLSFHLARSQLLPGQSDHDDGKHRPVEDVNDNEGGEEANIERYTIGTTAVSGQTARSFKCVGMAVLAHTASCSAFQPYPFPTS